MENPTHVEITILQARGLQLRGKYETNDAYVTVVLGKEKGQTYVLQRATNPFVWNDTFVLEIPTQGNLGGVIQLGVYHTRLLGDESLGTAAIFLKDFQPTSNPKLMTYNLGLKGVRSGQIVVSIVFRNLVFDLLTSPSITPSQRHHHSMKLVAKELMEAQQQRKPRRMSIRNIAQALITEKRSQCTKVEELVPRRDSNDNELKVETSPSPVPEGNFVRVQSARGKINTRRDVSSPLARSERSIADTETESDNDDIERLSSQAASNYQSRRSSYKSSSTIAEESEEIGIPLEFRGETKTSLIEMVNQLRIIVELQTLRIEDLEDYIDGRLARIMAKAPEALEMETESFK